MSAVQTTTDWHQKLTTPVAVLLGGRSAERAISLQTGQAVLEALRSSGIAAEPVDTAEDNWLQTVMQQYRHTFIALHGGDGEDGTVQAILHNLGISYTGSGMGASALAMDKVRSKYLWKGMGLPTPDFAVLRADSVWDELIQRFGQAIVKPASEGSSLGMSIASSAGELQAAYEQARQFQDSVLAEQWIEGPEYTVAILGQQALPSIRLETDNRFYDYEAKYVSDDTRYICPCGLDAGAEQVMQALAVDAFNSLGCSGWGRVDFMRDRAGRFYLLEVNTVPGMTSHSLVPMAARANGMSFEQLVEAILRLSLEDVA